MKRPKFVLLALLVSGGLAGASSTAFGQAAIDGSSPGQRAVAPQVPAGQIARYVATYMASLTGSGQRTATVVSITNNSSSTCTTAVDWKVGFGGVSCTTTLILAPGQTGEHCSRSINLGFVCNATCSPELTAIEGNAIIGSTSGSACAAIAVYARTLYTTGSSDETLNAVADANIVKVGAGNNGD
jgi:hypothetical protein